MFGLNGIKRFVKRQPIVAAAGAYLAIGAINLMIKRSKFGHIQTGQDTLNAVVLWPAHWGTSSATVIS